MSGVRSLNTNLASLKAQRQLTLNSQGVERTFERLSSGLRIVRASDDAAGLAVASSLNCDNRVYTQGVRNVNDGISFLNIADSAIENLKSIVIRCRELATQAANGTMTDTQRRALHEEAVSLQNEYNRILASAEFNGMRVFDATNSALKLQCGYGDSESLNVQANAGAMTTAPKRADLADDTEMPSVVSGDGRFMVYTHLATGIFVRDNQTGQSNLEVAATFCFELGISADGRYLAFSTSQSNLVP